MKTTRAGFVLLEAMIAVAVFAIGVIALGRCLENCIVADTMKEDDARARRALENEMALIEAQAKPLSDSATEEMKGMFAGMTMKTKRTQLKEKNEKDQEIFGLYDVMLEVTWMGGGEKQSKQLE